MTIIDQTIFFVKQQLQDAEGGHDWFHIERVYKNAILIAQEEVCNLTVVKLGALLHDIADSKFHDGDEEIGPKIARDFLISQQVDNETIAHIEKIISQCEREDPAEANAVLGRFFAWEFEDYQP